MITALCSVLFQLTVAVGPCVVSTIAGVGGKAYLDGHNTVAMFDNPSTLSIREDMMAAVIADKGNNLIRQLSLDENDDGKITTIGGNDTDSRSVDGVWGVTRFTKPVDICMYKNGLNALIVDQASPNNLIRKMDLKNKQYTTSTLHTDAGKLTSVAVAPNMTYALFTSDAQIKVLPLSANPVTYVFAGCCTGAGRTSVDHATGTSASFKTIRDITISSDGSFAVVVDDIVVRRIELTGSRRVTTIAGNNYMNLTFNAPTQVAIHPSGSYVLVTDTGNHRIVEVNLASPYAWVSRCGAIDKFGNYLRGFRDGFSTDPELQAILGYPEGIAIASSGKYAYISTITGHRIRKVLLETSSPTSSPTVSPTVDSAALAAAAVAVAEAKAAEEAEEQATIGGSIGGVLGVILIVVIIIIWKRRPKIGKYGVQIIDFSQLQMGKFLGKGAFGNVHLAIHQGTDVAIKLLEVESEESNQELDKEIFVNTLLPPHPNVVKMLGVAEGDKKGLVMELYRFRAIEDYRNDHEAEWLAVPFSTKLQIAIDISAGLCCMHECRLIHRDIACRNGLLRENFAASIADFGLSKPLVEGETVSVSEDDPMIPIISSSPETITKKQYSCKSDVYMFGIFLWELFAAAQPFADSAIAQTCSRNKNWSDFKDKVNSGELRPTIPDDWPEALVSIMTDCWNTHPAKRPSMASVNHQLRDLKEHVEHDNIPLPSTLAEDNEAIDGYAIDDDDDDGNCEEESGDLQTYTTGNADIPGTVSPQ